MTSSRYQKLVSHEDENHSTASSSTHGPQQRTQQQNDLQDTFGESFEEEEEEEERNNDSDRLINTPSTQPSSSYTAPAILPVSSDGVFSNISAKPESDSRKPEETPPTYEEAASDATPPYWQTTIIAPAGMGDIVLVEGMPVGNIFSFFWNLMRGSLEGDDYIDESQKNNDNNSVEAGIIAYMLMLLGWFVVIRSVADYLRAKQMEKIICSEPTPETIV
ncbi:hypothetical protein BY458DRAFT_537011 [Sporodiniella umbellata]|nr:hypothetical protein BY458DRAFT_537011 [Sporodiniella umbellata]